MTHAIILAAGRGSRMGALTHNQPKCFTPFRGKRLLDWQLTSLLGAGIDLTHIGLVRGYLAESFQESIHYFDNPRWSETNMVMSLYAAKSWLEQSTCIISYSDIIYPPEAIAKLLNLQADLAITYDPNWQKLWEKRFADPLSDAETFKINAQGQLLEIGQRAQTLDEIQGQYMGLLKITPIGWQMIAQHLHSLSPTQQDKLDMTSLLHALLQKNIVIQTVALDPEDEWHEIDSESDLKAAE